MSKTQDLTMAEERERTKVVPYALDIGSIVCYAVYHTWSVPCHESVKGYKNDPGMDHWTTVKIILSGIRICFSIMEVTKGSRKGLRRCKF